MVQFLKYSKFDALHGRPYLRQAPPQVRVCCTRVWSQPVVGVRGAGLAVVCTPCTMAQPASVCSRFCTSNCNCVINRVQCLHGHHDSVRVGSPMATPSLKDKGNHHHFKK